MQLRMELAASADRAWTSGDPWKYVSCLPGPHPTNDPFEVSELESQSLSSGKGKGKRPLEQHPERGGTQEKQPTKKAKKGVCRLHNTAPKGCPFGKECTFTHRCSHRRARPSLLPQCHPVSEPGWPRILKLSTEVASVRRSCLNIS
jgi:hypothetical protein